MRKYVICFIFSLFATYAISQDTLQVRSIEEKANNDKSQKLYENLQERSEKGKITRKLHQLIFRSINTSSSTQTTQSIEKDLHRNFSEFQGKKIRNIHIRTFDPFGFSERDSTKVPTNRWERMGNALHRKTQPVAIRKLLLFRKNQPLDSLLVKETERNIRSQNYVRRVLITPIATQSIDSVDINISVLDNWTIFFDGDVSTTNFSAQVQERNFLGLGNQVTFRHRQEIKEPYRTGMAFSYVIPNIYNTNINTYVTYSDDLDNFYEKRWGAYRSYYSIYTRWAGGLELSERTFAEDILYKDSIHSPNLKTQYKDFWGSVAFPVLKKYTAMDKRTNLIFSLRHYLLDYIKTPEYYLDSIGFYSDRKMYLASIGLSNMGYEQDRYIFRHEDIEDIPVGKNFSYIFGFQDNLGQRKLYSGIKTMYGAYWKIGYVAVDMQMGSFFHTNEQLQTTFRLETTYFSNLFSLGRWNFRQFIKFRSVFGFDRKNHVRDRITLNGRTGILEFNSSILSGTRKSILSFQTQSYSPFSWGGFRFSPFATFELGAIGQEGNSLWKDEFFPKINLGVLVSNDYLLFGDFQFSFFFLPRVPGKGSVFNFSSTRNEDFRLPNFNFRAPNVIPYE